METMKDIVAAHEGFLKEAPRKRTVLVKNQDGIIAMLFYSSPPGTPGVAVQFIDDDLCYVFNDEARWEFIGAYENANKFFNEKYLFERKKKSETA